MRSMLSIAMVACWSSAPPPSHERHVMMVQAHDPPPCSRFDEKDPACRSACPRDAPNQWVGCAQQIVELISQGWICNTPSPWQCVQPPPLPPCPPTGCLPITSRVIATSKVGHDVELTMIGGSNQGITLQWTATLLDGQDRKLPGGGITLTRIDKDRSKGIVQGVTAAHHWWRVLLEP